MFKTILFPLDQSRESREAAEVAIQLAKAHQSDRIILLSVMEDVMEASRMGAMSWAWSGLEAEEGVIVADEEVTSSFGVLGGVTGVAMMGC